MQLHVIGLDAHYIILYRRNFTKYLKGLCVRLRAKILTIYLTRIKDFYLFLFVIFLPHCLVNLFIEQNSISVGR